MQERTNSKQKAGGPLGIRTSVWLVICGLLVTCVLLISVARRHATPPALHTVATDSGAAPRDSSPARSAVRSVHQVPIPESVSEAEMQPGPFRASAAISNELSIAREKLTELRSNYGKNHPEVEEQVQAIASLERSALAPGETLELAKARADLARLEARFGPQHPDLQAQSRFVESLEQGVAAGEPSDLAQAKAQLARLRVLYGEGHPDVQTQLKKVAGLQR